jgi:hypothetical protein
MFGPTWRLRASNSQNQTITVTVKARYFKFGASGIEWSSEQTLISAAAITAGSSSASGTVDNSSDLYLGMVLTMSCTASSTTDGTGAVTLTLEQSTDGGTTWPTASRGLPAGQDVVLAADTTSTVLRNVEVR